MRAKMSGRFRAPALAAALAIGIESGVAVCCPSPAFADIITVSPTNVNASSSYPGYPAADAIDTGANRSLTDWAANGDGVGSYLDISFPTVETLTSVMLTDRTTSGGLNGQFAGGTTDYTTKFELQVYSDATFTTPAGAPIGFSKPIPPNPTTPAAFTFTASLSGLAAEYLRFTILAVDGSTTNTSSNPGLADIEFSAEASASGSPALSPPGSVHLPFAAGSTRITAEGAKTGHYVVTAASGQPLLVDAVPVAGGETMLGITAVPEGTVLLSENNVRSEWHEMLTRTGDYLISVRSIGTPGSFRLTIEAPAPVHFPAGTGRASRSGPTPGGLPVDYAVHAAGGQTLSASVTASDGAAELELTPLRESDSVRLTQPMPFTSFRFFVPTDGDYIISVVPHSGALIHYTLDLALTN